jgi:type II secretory pathway component PulF
MATFAYTALDAQGRQASGTITADSRGMALDLVAQQGLSPVSVDEQANGGGAHGTGSAVSVGALWQALGGRTRVPQSAVEAFTRELANLLAAGLPLSRALHLLRREASHPAARTAWSTVHDDVVGGMPLADALAKWPRVFSTVYVAMVRAGEAGGFLDVVLQQIADFRSREQDLVGRVKAAMIYPCVLALLGCAVLVFLLTFFIPRFSTIFSEFGSELPWLTRVIVAASEGVLRYGLVLLVAAVLAVVGARRAIATDAGRRVLERVVLRLPGFGRVIARFALVRFCRMLGTLVGAGVPLISALRVAKEALGNQTLSDTVSHAIDEVQRGAPLARSLAVSAELFPASVIEMVTVAEETGRLDKELIRLSTAYEGDLDRRLRMLVALAEPALLFVMAGIIGTVVVAMILPVFTLWDVVH